MRRAARSRSRWTRAAAPACCLCLAGTALLGGPPATVTASAKAPTYVVPVVVGQLIGPMRRFRAYVASRLSTLDGQLSTLLAAERAGALGAAESDWLPAHLSWLAIGEDDKSYSAFGALGQTIDGSAGGLPGGVASARFTGFHRVEYDLWVRRSTTAAATDTVRLERQLTAIPTDDLSRWLPASAGALSSWVVRCHEILEDTDRDTLSGEDDYGSGTEVASVTADVAATREVLDLLASDIDARAPGVVRSARGRLDRVMAAALATRSDGAWVGIAQLPVRERERLDGAVGGALEKLAPISDLLHVAGGAT